MTTESTEEAAARLALLRAHVGNFPKLPGVYLMRDERGGVIYVGKAKDLRARVRSYFAGSDERLQIEFLLKKIRSIDTIVTENEQQAFVLERDLITQHKPRYNIRLKDDKAYLCLRIDENAPWPRLELVRKVTNDGARYFGPYSFSYELRSLLDIIKRVVPLRTCTDTVFFNRARPCLEYQIKRCAGPCTLPVDKEQYRRWVKQAIAVLEGKTDPVVKELTAAMEGAADDLRFEDAAAIRDRLQVLEHFKKGAALIASKGEERDVFAIYREEGLAVVAVLKVRNGRVADNVNFSFHEVQVTDDELLESVLEQYYGGSREVPPEIVVPFEPENLSILKEDLRTRRQSGCEFVVPQRGVKARLLNLALVNAKQHFATTFDAETRAMELSRGLARILGLKQMPRRIECVDISNFQGSDIVGAVVAFFDGQPDKQRYRKYKIQGRETPDDFASIEEVVGRRLERGMAEGDLPDLLIIDGGLGQLGRALAARDALKLNLEIVALAKMRTERDFAAREVATSQERIFVEGSSEPIVLESSAEVTHFVQRIRDEAHRFVITFHRTRRAKRVFRSALDDISGVGPERRGRLLRHYGSIERIRNAPVDEVAMVGRMPRPLAEKIIQKLNRAEGE
jgi:excinuclease ABC subunit C